ncbi:MAG: hypothetical protein COY81_00270 [Candidatus Pacebacteria bacterium CG_4_10_14_0_8_um_filter_43_12]|nr:MAG: hypothetical protein COY81_00270 [Candidatus Pacebacteria bacterium CG_4_10_14_0_8_um_filter_43_12]
MKQLTLGMIGLSPGNGHPYSWSAIFNGYDQSYMANCPFPIISQYLSKQSFPEDQIKQASVTHIWTQNKTTSNQIAKATFIPTIVDSYQDMIGQVDGILLARDDAENHLMFAKPFLEAGLPIYIDKPLAYDTKTAQKLFNLQQYKHQLFTASALAYSPEFILDSSQRAALGKIITINAVVIKDWLRYGVHVIEPVLKMINWQQPIQKVSVTSTKLTKVVTVAWQDGLVTTFQVLGDSSAPITIDLIGKDQSIRLVHTDTFTAFKNSLQHFIKSISKQNFPPSQEFVMQVINVIEQGNLND